MDNPTFILLSSLDKVSSVSGPLYYIENSGSMLKNEVYSFQAALKSNQPLSKVQIYFSTTLNARIEIYSIKEVFANNEYGDNPDDYFLPLYGKMYPELLLDNMPIDIPAGTWHSWWISVILNENTDPGVYKLNVWAAEGNGQIIGQCVYTLEVIDKALEKVDIFLTNWVHYDCICNQHNVEMFSNDFYNVLNGYITEYINCGFNAILTPTITPPLDTAVDGERMTCQLVGIKKHGNNYDFDFEKLNYFIDFMRERGIKYFEFAHLFTQWGAEFCPKVIIEENGESKKYFGWQTKSTSDEYLNFLSQYLPALHNFTLKKGIKDYCYYHISDEPYEEHLDRYAFLYHKIKSIVKDIKTMDAMSRFEFYQKKVVDLPVVGTTYAQKFLDNNVPHLSYYCCSQNKDYVSNRFFAMPSERNRILGIQLYLNEAKGFLHWGYNFYNSQYSVKAIDPYEDNSAGGGFPSGDSFIVYPKENTVSKSTRFMVLCEAFQDYSALKTLEKMTSKDYVMGLLKEQGLKGYNTYPHSAKWLKEFREKINKFIQKVRQA